MERVANVSSNHLYTTSGKIYLYLILKFPCPYKKRGNNPGQKSHNWIMLYGKELCKDEMIAAPHLI